MRRIVTPTGAIDGSNALYTLPSGFSYISGTVFPIVNGVTIDAASDNGCLETSSTTVTMKEVLLTGDTLLLSIDDGQLANTAHDINIDGQVTSYKIEYNVTTYPIEYNLQAYKLEYNTTFFAIEYNIETYSIKPN